MGASRRFGYEPRVFQAGELRRGIDRVRDKLFGDDSAVQVTIHRELSDGTNHSEHKRPVEALSTLCDLATEGINLTLKFGRPSGTSTWLDEEISAHLRTDSDQFLAVYVDADTPEQLLVIARALEAELELVPAPPLEERVKQSAEEELGGVGPPLIQLIEHLTARVADLERTRGVASSSLTCFLSFQFSEPSQSYAAQVKRFLELLDVRVVTGLGYEPRPINEKVRHRLAQDVDFVVLIDVADKKSAWTRDEIARAQNPGVFLIPLVEEGAQFDSGIFGDHEYIPFAVGHVCDAFTGLLEGISYIQRIRSSSSPNRKEESYRASSMLPHTTEAPSAAAAERSAERDVRPGTLAGHTILGPHAR